MKLLTIRAKFGEFSYCFNHFFFLSNQTQNKEYKEMEIYIK